MYLKKAVEVVNNIIMKADGGYDKIDSGDVVVCHVICDDHNKNSKDLILL